MGMTNFFSRLYFSPDILAKGFKISTHILKYSWFLFIGKCFRSAFFYGICFSFYVFSVVYLDEYHSYSNVYVWDRLSKAFLKSIRRISDCSFLFMCSIKFRMLMMHEPITIPGMQVFFLLSNYSTNHWPKQLCNVLHHFIKCTTLKK